MCDRTTGGATNAILEGFDANRIDSFLDLTGDDFSKFTGVSWNVDGLSIKEWDSFCGAISREVSWQVLLLQEFSAYTGILKRLTGDGHWVFPASSKKGQRRMAIIVHYDAIKFIVKDSFAHSGEGDQDRFQNARHVH